MSKILEGMARASLRIKTQEGFDRSTEHAKVGEIVGMRDALLWLADNVSDEMADTADDACDFNSVRAAMRSEDWRFCIAAALRAAAGDKQ